MSEPAHAAPTGGGFAHALIHGVQVFAVAFAASLGLVAPHKVTTDLVVSAILGGIRAVVAYFHH